MRSLTTSLIIILISTASFSQSNKKIKKTPILNFGTFHMGETSDATKTEFDEYDRKNQKEVHEIAQQLAAFKPTVIIVEMDPKYNDELNATYQKYCNNPDMHFSEPSEVELLAFELGRLSKVEKFYGIDHKMNYNYRVGHDMVNQIDSISYDQFYDDPYKFFPEIDMTLYEGNTSDKLKIMNHNSFLDFLITYNADMLSHAGTEDGFEGADEAAKYYQRNLRMYSNLNRIDFKEDDRVFILMGGSHTAFFRDFISRSPKYKMVDTFKYLK